MGRFGYLNEDLRSAEDIEAQEADAASFTDPVMRTREIKAGRPFDIPGSLVSDAPDLERQQQRLVQQRLKQESKRYPELGRHFSDPERAAGGWDDVGSISGVIDSVLDATGISRVGQAYTSGKANVDMVSIVTSVMAADKAGVAVDPGVFAKLERLRQEQAAFDPGDLGLEDVIPLVAQQIPNLSLMAKYGIAGAALAGTASAVTGFSTLPVAIPLGGTAGAALAMSPVEMTSAYMEYRELQDEAGNKLDPDIAIGMAASYGVMAGAVEAGGSRIALKFASILGISIAGSAAGQRALDSLAAKKLMRKALANTIKGSLQGKTKRDLFRTIGKGVAAAVVSQGLEEGTQEWLNVAGGVAAQAIERESSGAFAELDVFEGLVGAETRERVTEAAAIGGLTGFGIAGAGATVGGTAGLAARSLSGKAEAAETFGEKLDRMEEVRQNSRLAQEDPVAFAEAVETETRNLEPVSIDAAGLVKFYQGDLAAVEAAVPSLTQEAISTAADAGMDVQIPFSEYVAYVSGSKLSEGFKANARVDGRALTLSQVEGLSADLDQQLELAKQGEEEDFDDAAYNEFVTDIFDQLRNAGVNERVARMTSKVWGAAQFNLAERAGFDPLEEYAGARITGEGTRARSLFQPLTDVGTVDSPAFKAFFGESKVVDEAGEPRRVFHGTSRDVEAFDPAEAGIASSFDPGLIGRAFYFTGDAEQAGQFALGAQFRDVQEGRAVTEEGANVLPVFLSLQNPFIIEDGVLPDGRTLTDIHPRGISADSGAALQEEIKAAGHDGVILRSGGEDVQFVAFEPTQIKSVSNRGTFDPSDPRILFQPAITAGVEVTDIDPDTFLQSDFFREGLNTDEFLYHVTTEDRLQSIQEQGLTPDAEPAFTNQRVNAAGKVFLTEREGIAFWIERVEAHAQANFDDPPAVKVVRVPRDSVQGLQEDTEGTRDARSPAFFVEQAVVGGPRDSVQSISSQLAVAHPTVDFTLLERRNGNLELASIVVPKEERKQGTGTAFMEDLVAFADASGKTVELTPATRDDVHGTTSRGRLVKFYKRFGFVENKGRNKDFTLRSDVMFREPKPQAFGPNLLFQPAFHGTAAKFDKFTLDHIGTGEGAQAFGWGLYFAELRDVAELYRKSLKPQAKRLFKGEDISRDDLASELADAVAFNRPPEEVDILARRAAAATLIAQTRLRDLTGEFQVAPEDVDAAVASLEQSKRRLEAELEGVDPDTVESARITRPLGQVNAQLEVVRDIDPDDLGFEEQAGQLFAVEIPEDSELLDYDKPLSEQPEGVREKLEAAGIVDFASLDEANRLQDEIDAFPEEVKRNIPIDHPLRDLIERRNDLIDSAARNSTIPRLVGVQDVTGNDLYSAIADKEGSVEAASRALLAAGIPGLKYFDGFSRTKEQGTSNYVIWDETAINILQTFFQPEGRAEVAFADSGELLIKLKAAADESTALHEFSHGFLDKMVRLGANLDESHQINQDLGIIRQWWKDESKSVLKWLKSNQEKLPLGAFEEIMDRGGVAYLEEQALTANLDLNADMDLAAQGATIGFHEHFARGAELYMYEGKAPSSQLRDAFAAFVDWMTEIYKDVQRALGVELNDEVRGVLDRLVASDAQIEASQRERSDELQNIESALELSPKAAEELQEAREQKAREAKQTVRQRALKAERRKRKQLESSLRPEIQRQVEQEISERRDYKAHDYVKARKLNRPAVVSLVTTELATAAARFTSPKGPTLPEELQGRYGYDSVPEMLEAIAGLPPIKQAVKEETDRRLLERLGPPEVEQPVESVVESTAGQEKVLKAELAAIAGQAAVGRAARLRVAETGAVAPAEQRAAREAAQEALATATTPEETEAATLEIARLEAERAPSEQERRSASARRSQEASVRRQARAEASELKAVAEARVANLRSAEVKPEAFPRAQDHARREVDRALRDRNYVVALEHQRRRVMLHFAHKAAVKAQRKIKAAVKRAKQLQKASTQKSIGAALPSALEQINSLLDRSGLLSARIRNFADISHPPMIKWMDTREAAGEDVGGISPFMLGHIPAFEDMKLHEVEAFDETLKAIREIARLSDVVIIDGESHKLADIIDRLVASIEENDQSRKKIPSKDRNVIGFVPLAKRALRRFDATLIKMEQIIDWLDGGDIEGPMREFVFTQISAAQAAEADMQRDIPHKIIAAFEALSKRRLNTKIFIPEVDQTFRVSDIMSVALNLGTESSYQKVKEGESWDDTQIDAILSHLNDAELDTVEEIWTTLEELGELLFDTHEELTGIRPSKLEVRSFTTPGGREMSGGYYPAVYDPTKGEQGAKNYESGNAPIFENNYTTRGVDTTTGATIGRTRFAAPIWFDMGVLPSHVSEVIHDVTHRQALNNVWRVVSNGRVRVAIDESLGVEYREMFKPWLQSIGNDRVGVNKDLRVWARMFSGLRTNTAIMAMGLKATTQLSQIAGFSNSMGRAFEAGYRGELLNQMRRVILHPIEMRDYAFAKSGEMRNRAKNLDRDLRDVGRKLAGKSGVLQKSQQFSMHGIAVMDLVVSVPTWHAGYNAALRQGLSEKAAIEFGDREVRLSQGGGGAKDLAEVQRGAEFWKLFTNFYSFLSALYSQIRDTGHQVHSLRDVPQAMAKYFFYVTVGSMLAEALSNRWPDEDDDMTALEMALWKSATAPLTTVPILREFVGVVESGRTYQLSPTQAAGESVARVLTQTIDLFDEDSDVDFGQFSKNTLQLTGYMLGLPINQLQITFTNVRRVIEEGADYNLWDILFYQKEE